MEKLSFKLPVFEGPLDLLLYLISKNKLDIYDIEISELLSQYMEYISEMGRQDIEIESSFLEMASRLVQIKSSLLLPQKEEALSQREQFITELIGYKTCKLMAAALAHRNGGFDAYTKEQQDYQPDLAYSCRHEISELVLAYSALAGKIKRRRPPTAAVFNGIVGRKSVSVVSRIIHILRRLVKDGKKGFYALFEDTAGRSEAVATFLAVLELIKSGKIAVSEDQSQTVSPVGGRRFSHARRKKQTGGLQ